MVRIITHGSTNPSGRKHPSEEIAIEIDTVAMRDALINGMKATRHEIEKFDGQRARSLARAQSLVRR